VKEVKVESVKDLDLKKKEEGNLFLHDIILAALMIDTDMIEMKKITKKVNIIDDLFIYL
jgi:hypothetical protein